MSRLSLLPLRSLAALTDPRRAAQRLLHVLTGVLGCAQVSCELVPLQCSLQRRGRTREGVLLRRYRIPLRWQGEVLGHIELEIERERWTRLRGEARALAGVLAFALALHASSARLRGTVLTPRRLHDLNNVVNTLTLQIGLIRALLQRGQNTQAADFANRCEAQAERLVTQLHQLRKR